MTDENGVVTEKFFHRHYATRESAGAIRDSALGEILARHEVPAIELGTDQVQISAFLSDTSLKFETQSTLYVRFELEDGLHMYGRPLPDGYIASEATISDTPGLRVGAARYPTTAPREFPELGVTLNVYEGVVDVAIPVTPNAELFNPREPRPTGGADGAGVGGVPGLQRDDLLHTEDGDAVAGPAGRAAVEAWRAESTVAAAHVGRLSCCGELAEGTAEDDGTARPCAAGRTDPP